ncbi:MAG: phosphatase PAP2 family protein [Butyrivibrio sp.]|nr:phosphatase PAP2 family protein [Muribaculum sp.]MCM1551218.1 phosphatase PAP2 family protein [Butyrivibrio sp.]
MLGKFLELESEFMLFVQEFLRNDGLTLFFAFITGLGNSGCIWQLVSVLLMIPERTRRVGCMGICALLLSLLVNNMILKNLVARARPYDAIPALLPLIRKPGGFSFPSGHTASSFAAAGLFVRNLPRGLGVPLLLLAVLIGISRVYLGVHYPSDVIAGALSGWLISMAVENFTCQKQRK